MKLDDALALIRPAVEGQPGMWADLGAGRGTFTRALAQVLGPESRIVAVDADPAAVAELQAWARAEEPRVAVLPGNFAGDLELPELDGILLANSLHFIKDAASVLKRLVTRLRANGRVVLVEYDRRGASRWVPYPIAILSLPALAKSAGLGKFTVVESRPSNYEGIIYAAVASRAQAAEGT